MEENRTHSTPIGAVAALAMAGGAFLAFLASDAVGSRSDAAGESIFVLTWVAGWVVLVWAVLVGGRSLVKLTRRALARRAVSRLEVALLSASVALVVLAVSTHPLWGSGSGAGSAS